MFEFIAHDWLCSKPDEVDRDVRHGQVTQDHDDDDDDVCMYVCGGTISTLSCLMYVQYKSVYMLTVDHMMTPR